MLSDVQFALAIGLIVGAIAGIAFGIQYAYTQAHNWAVKEVLKYENQSWMRMCREGIISPAINPTLLNYSFNITALGGN